MIQEIILRRFCMNLALTFTDIPNFKKMVKEARSNFGLFTQF